MNKLITIRKSDQIISTHYIKTGRATFKADMTLVLIIV